MIVKAIPTKYAGVRFRSRLEARWAFFFDTLEVMWRYEHEGYQLRSDWYLPDFWLPEIETWFEVKGKEPTRQEEKLCRELAETTKNRVVIAHGDFGWWTIEHRRGPSGGLKIFNPHKEEEGYEPCVCATCGRFGFEYEGRATRICKHNNLDDRNDASPLCGTAVEKANRHSFY